MNILIVVPTYNEVQNLEPLLTAIAKAPFEVLVVDDGSPDGTGALADQLKERLSPRVHVLHRTEKKGLGKAYLAGFDWGLKQNRFDAIVEMDADFSHHPRFLPAMAENLALQDVVIGSRYVHGGGTVNWGFIRKCISRGGSFYARTILGIPVQDLTGGFNGWRVAVLQAIQLSSVESNGYAFQIELKYRAFLKGFKIKEFPIVFEDRKVGQSKMSFRILLEALFKVWRFRLTTK